MITKSQLLGMAGEHRVFSELLLRGYNFSISIIDDGIDCVLDNGLKIQIKTSHHSPTGYKVKGKTYKYSIYNFNFQKGSYKKGKPVQSKRTMLPADFSILWCVEDNEFYIIPREAVNNTQKVYIRSKRTGRKQPSRFDEYLGKWELLRGVI